MIRETVMQTVNIHEAKTHLSRFVDEAAAGEEIVIARAGKPVARLVALAQPEAPARRLGLGKGRFTLPAGFDGLSADEIPGMFEGGR
jgi:prevent-host-death family protein